MIVERCAHDLIAVTCAYCTRHPEAVPRVPDENPFRRAFRRGFGVVREANTGHHCRLCEEWIARGERAYLLSGKGYVCLPCAGYDNEEELLAAV